MKKILFTKYGQAVMRIATLLLLMLISFREDVFAQAIKPKQKTQSEQPQAVVSVCQKAELTNELQGGETESKIKHAQAQVDKAYRKAYLAAKSDAEKKKILQGWAKETQNPAILKRIQSRLAILTD